MCDFARGLRGDDGGDAAVDEDRAASTSIGALRWDSRTHGRDTGLFIMWCRRDGAIGHGGGVELEYSEEEKGISPRVRLLRGGGVG